MFDSYLLAVSQLEERKRQLDLQLAACSETEPYREPVGCLRRITVMRLWPGRRYNPRISA